MSQTKNGLDEYEQGIDDYLEGWARTLGLPKIKLDIIGNVVEKAFELSSEQIRKLSREEADEMAVALTQYSIHLQRNYNQERAKALWFEQKVKLMVVDVVDKMSGYSYEERRLAAIKKSETASEIEKRRLAANVKAENISFLARQVEELAKVLRAVGGRYERG